MYELGVGSVSGYKLKMYFYCIKPPLRGSPERQQREEILFMGRALGGTFSHPLCVEKKET